LAAADANSWVEHLNAAGIPCSHIYDVARVFNDPQVQSQNMQMTVTHPKHGDMEVLGFPIKFAAAPCDVRMPPPDLGEHTSELLAELYPSGD